MLWLFTRVLIVILLADSYVCQAGSGQRPRKQPQQHTHPASVPMLPIVPHSQNAVQHHSAPLLQNPGPLLQHFPQQQQITYQYQVMQPQASAYVQPSGGYLHQQYMQQAVPSMQQQQQTQMLTPEQMVQYYVQQGYSYDQVVFWLTQQGVLIQSASLPVPQPTYAPSVAVELPHRECCYNPENPTEFHGYSQITRYLKDGTTYVVLAGPTEKVTVSFTHDYFYQLNLNCGNGDQCRLLITPLDCFSNADLQTQTEIPIIGWTEPFRVIVRIDVQTRAKNIRYVSERTWHILLKNQDMLVGSFVPKPLLFHDGELCFADSVPKTVVVPTPASSLKVPSSASIPAVGSAPAVPAATQQEVDALEELIKGIGAPSATYQQDQKPVVPQVAISQAPTKQSDKLQEKKQQQPPIVQPVVPGVAVAPKPTGPTCDPAAFPALKDTMPAKATALLTKQVWNKSVPVDKSVTTPRIAAAPDVTLGDQDEQSETSGDSGTQEVTQTIKQAITTEKIKQAKTSHEQWDKDGPKRKTARQRKEEQRAKQDAQKQAAEVKQKQEEDFPRLETPCAEVPCYPVAVTQTVPVVLPVVVEESQPAALKKKEVLPLTDAEKQHEENELKAIYEQGNLQQCIKRYEVAQKRGLLLPWMSYALLIEGCLQSDKKLWEKANEHILTVCQRHGDTQELQALLCVTRCLLKLRNPERQFSINDCVQVLQAIGEDNNPNLLDACKTFFEAQPQVMQGWLDDRQDQTFPDIVEKVLHTISRFASVDVLGSPEAAEIVDLALTFEAAKRGYTYDLIDSAQFVESPKNSLMQTMRNGYTYLLQRVKKHATEQQRSRKRKIQRQSSSPQQQGPASVDSKESIVDVMNAIARAYSDEVVQLTQGDMAAFADTLAALEAKIPDLLEKRALYLVLLKLGLENAQGTEVVRKAIIASLKDKAEDCLKKIVSKGPDGQMSLDNFAKCFPNEDDLWGAIAQNQIAQTQEVQSIDMVVTKVVQGDHIALSQHFLEQLAVLVNTKSSTTSNGDVAKNFTLAFCECVDKIRNKAVVDRSVDCEKVAQTLQLAWKNFIDGLTYNPQCKKYISRLKRLDEAIPFYNNIMLGMHDLCNNTGKNAIKHQFEQAIAKVDPHGRTTVDEDVRFINLVQQYCSFCKNPILRAQIGTLAREVVEKHLVGSRKLSTYRASIQHAVDTGESCVEPSSVSLPLYQHPPSSKGDKPKITPPAIDSAELSHVTPPIPLWHDNQAVIFEALKSQQVQPLKEFYSTTLATYENSPQELGKAYRRGLYALCTLSAQDQTDTASIMARAERVFSEFSQEHMDASRVAEVAQQMRDLHRLFKDIAQGLKKLIYQKIDAELKEVFENYLTSKPHKDSVQELLTVCYSAVTPESRESVLNLAQGIVDRLSIQLTGDDVEEIQQQYGTVINSLRQSSAVSASTVSEDATPRAVSFDGSTGPLVATMAAMMSTSDASKAQEEKLSACMHKALHSFQQQSITLEDLNKYVHTMGFFDKDMDMRKAYDHITTLLEFFANSPDFTNKQNEVVTVLIVCIKALNEKRTEFYTALLQKISSKQIVISDKAFVLANTMQTIMTTKAHLLYPLTIANRIWMVLGVYENITPPKISLTIQDIGKKPFDLELVKESFQVWLKQCCEHYNGKEKEIGNAFSVQLNNILSCMTFLPHSFKVEESLRVLAMLESWSKDKTCWPRRYKGVQSIFKNEIEKYRDLVQLKTTEDSRVVLAKQVSDTVSATTHELDLRLIISELCRNNMNMCVKILKGMQKRYLTDAYKIRDEVQILTMSLLEECQTQADEQAVIKGLKNAVLNVFGGSDLPNDSSLTLATGLIGTIEIEAHITKAVKKLPDIKVMTDYINFVLKVSNIQTFKTLVQEVLQRVAKDKNIMLVPVMGLFSRSIQNVQDATKKKELFEAFYEQYATMAIDTLVGGDTRMIYAGALCMVQGDEATFSYIANQYLQRVVAIDASSSDSVLKFNVVQVCIENALAQIEESGKQAQFSQVFENLLKKYSPTKK